MSFTGNPDPPMPRMVRCLCSNAHCDHKPSQCASTANWDKTAGWELYQGAILLCPPCVAVAKRPPAETQALDSAARDIFAPYWPTRKASDNAKGETVADAKTDKTGDEPDPIR